jgi:hypothetical protein
VKLVETVFHTQAGQVNREALDLQHHAIGSLLEKGEVGMHPDSDASITTLYLPCASDRCDRPTRFSGGYHLK